MRKGSRMVRSAPVSLRLPPEMKDALAHAATAEDRTLTNLIERILRLWLADHGHMQASPAPKAAARKKAAASKL